MTLPGMPLHTLTLFTADPWESAMTYLRVLGPAQLAGVRCLQGNHAGQFHLDCISESDLVILQRDFPRFPGYEVVVERARQEGKPVVYEVDDLILEVPPEHVSYLALVDHLGSLLKCAVEADAVVTSNRLLRDYYAAFNPRTYTVPNYLADTVLPLRTSYTGHRETQPRGESQPRGERQALVIGYMGGASHLPDLEMVQPVLLPLLSEQGNATLRIWGVRPSEAYLTHPRVEWVPMDILRYPEFGQAMSRQACDLWIAPLADSFFNRCKSSVKYLEYSALGAAGVYSRVRPYEEIVVDGENGLLAGTLEEWDASLRRLLQDADLRSRLGQGAAATVRQGWLMTSCYPEWVSIYETILNGRGETSPDAAPRAPSPALQSVVRVMHQFQTRHDTILSERHALADELQAIRSSRSWQMITRLGRIREKAIPTGSRRQRILTRLLRLFS